MARAAPPTRPRRRSPARLALQALLALLAIVLAAAGLVLVFAERSSDPTGGNEQVVWIADAERPMEEEWAAWSAESLDRLERVEEPRAQGAAAYRFELEDDDDAFGERAELGTGNGEVFAGQIRDKLFLEGQERWIAWQTYLPEDFPIDTSDWHILHQLKCTGGGGPSVAIEARDGKWRLKTGADNQRSNSRQLDRWESADEARRERWVKFTLHVRFSPDSSVGFVELYGDLDGGGVVPLMPRLATPTMKYEDDSSEVIPTMARIGIYRDPESSDDEHVYHDGYTVARTRAAAEANAFRE